ncbi:MAG: DHHW family protein [Oscillospiraceae bacterium]|jgi:hypothetical protein|nr:DHHW family protein [Oscillospiraceae bacterium]
MQKQKQERVLIAIFLLLIFGFSVTFWLLPKSSFSAEEKRALQPAPEFSAATVGDGTFASTVESYLSDHFPLRRELVGLHAYGSLICGNNGQNGIYFGKDGWLINKPVSVNPANFQQNLDSIKDFSQKEHLPAYLMAVPTTGFIMDDELPDAHEDYPDAQLLGEAKAKTEGAVQWVNLAGVLSSHSADAPLYYHTDHHWTSRGAYLAYDTFACDVGFHPMAQAAFRVRTSGGFYGTTYAKSGFWFTRPDTLEVWQNPNLTAKVEICEDGQQAKTSDNLFYWGQLKNEDQYPVFLNGNHSLVRLCNPNSSGKRLLIVKDSYANCLAPFLLAHYSQIDMVDLRYFRKTAASQLVKQDRLTSILFCYGLDDLVNDRNLSLLA